MSQRKGKRFAFTLNNYNGDEEQRCRAFIEADCSYGIIGKEVGEHGTPHLQGFCILREALAVLDAKDRFIDENPSTWYGRGSTLLRNYQLAQRPSDRSRITVEWVYGPPGIGKSRYAHEKYPEAYIKDPRTKWWNGYLQEKEVIIDDFGPGGIDINHLLRWFDRYKCYVESKGSMVALRAESFIVTSNFHPRDCFRGDSYSYNTSLNVSDVCNREHVQLPALMRRIILKELLYLIESPIGPGKVSTAIWPCA